VLVLAVGAGLAFAHAGEPVGRLAAGLGPALLGAGAVLALVAGWRVLATTRRRWWAVAVPLLLLATYLSLWTVGQAVAASFPGRSALGTRTPADLGLTYRAVTFPAADGVQLAGWYLPAENGAAVALLHGAGSTRSAVLAQAAVLARHGYGVLLFDARGHGESAGHAMDFGWYGELDTPGAVDFLLRQPGVRPGQVGLVGLSMGGEQAIGAAGADDRVAAVVAEGATNRVAADKAYLSEYGVRGEIQQGVDRLTTAVTDLLTDAPRPAPLAESVAAAAGRSDPTRFLLVAAGRVETEGLAAEHLRSVAPGAVRTWIVPGAGHTAGLRVAGAEWEERVVGFLDATLAGAGA
jgi:predicted alpha/beta hydrolase